MRILTSFLLLFSLTVLGQQSQNMDVLFQRQCQSCAEPFVSQIFEVNQNTADLPFVGISGFYKSTSLSSNLYYRINSEQGWSEWIGMHENHEALLLDRKAFEGKPIETSFNSIQFKSSNELEIKVRFRLYFPKVNSQDSPFNFTQTNSSCSCIQPAYCDRNCWCPANNCPVDTTPSFTNPTHLIVHHSAGFNTSSDFAAVVAYYWDLHVNTNGWDDIGYNWLIDPNGVVYEGRGDGVRGAHFSCMNGNTMGICMIGNFQNQAPTTLALDRLKEFLAWEACDKNIVPNISSFHNSSLLNLEHISGHRDGNNSTTGCPSGTVCPGTFLYNDLVNIRQDIAGFPCIQGVSIEELKSDHLVGVSLFPNPANDRLKLTMQLIKAKDFELAILDSKGKIVRTYSDTAKQAIYSIELNVEDLEKGVYWVQLKTKDGEASRRFILD